jgi:hypothetical protein
MRWPLDLGAQPLKELLKESHPKRLKQHLFAAGEQPVDRGSRDTALGHDVVHRDLGDTPALTTALSGIKILIPGEDHT